MPPFRSESQRKFFNANRKKLESEGVDVDEFNKASKGLKLPMRIGKKKKQYRLADKDHDSM